MKSQHHVRTNVFLFSNVMPEHSPNRLATIGFPQGGWVRLKCSAVSLRMCETARNASILCQLQEVSNRWGWHVRPHRPFHDRHPPGNELMTIRTSRVA
jgi:hypothetical protein